MAERATVTVRVPVAADLIQWAVDRSGRDVETLQNRFPHLQAWTAGPGPAKPTLRQLEDFAKATYTPVGFFFLPTPPDEPLPLPDFRTVGDEQLERPSANLLETIYLCEQRQEWYRAFAQREDLDPVAFVGSFSRSTPVRAVSEQMARDLDFAEESRGSTWAAALSTLSERAERAGVLVMISGVVGSNTTRVLDPEEFRGFAITDALAPLIFVNGADTKAAQVFTLAHELAHLYLGQSAVSKPEPGADTDNADERWCNEVAAEFLVPLTSLRSAYNPERDLTEELDGLARRYKVSTLVVLRRLFDASLMNAEVFFPAYRAERERVMRFAAGRTTNSGGDFYNTAPVRASKRFARAIITDVQEGRTLHRDAFRLLGTSKPKVVEELGRRLGAA